MKKHRQLARVGITFQETDTEWFFSYRGLAGAKGQVRALMFLAPPHVMIRTLKKFKLT